MDISIITVNYKTRGLLKQCLKGFQSKPIHLQYEVIVVDNNSNDGTVEMMKTEFPNVRFIASPINRGFAGGVNLGIAQATGKYILTLNTDIAVLGTPFEEMFAFMENHPAVGVCAPKLLNPDGTVQTSCRKFPSAMMIVLRRSPLGKLPSAKKKLRHFLMLDWDHNDNRPVDWVLGACMMARRSAMDKVGLLDERFFLYFEDVDWCRRFWQAGFAVYYLGATTEIVHYHRRQSAVSPGLSGVLSYATRLHVRSGLQYFVKYRNVATPQVFETLPT